MVADRQVLEDVGFGKGHLSTVHLVHEEKYGGKVILKIPGGEMSKTILSISEKRFQTLHNTEVDIYNIIENHSEFDVAHPKIFETEKMEPPVTGGFILMEYIPEVTHLYANDNVKAEELVEPVKNIARLHALGERLNEAERRLVPTDFLKGWFLELFTEKNKALFMSVWQPGKMADFMSSPQSADAIRVLSEILTPDEFARLNDDCQMSGVKAVFCHGDLSSHNVLFEKLPNGSMKFRSICDFQGSNWGNAAQDLTRLFVTALSGQDRREKGEHLLKIYYDELVRVTRGKAPFTWEQLTRSYTRFLPHHAAIVCVTTPGKFLRSLAEMEEGAEKEEFKTKMLEKYIALMEDLNEAWKSRTRV
ncbi:unnamed protein product [Caenorhabditis sp. 36 PRJEB53466]|nr:unnamed protein product [Caenorhabditis sp. 36 PRJEB53466]